MPSKFLPEISLDSDATNKWRENIQTCINTATEKLNVISERMENLNSDFDLLQTLADRVTTKYEKTESGCQDMHEKMVLQDILHHHLSKQDIKLFCRYVEELFFMIIKSLHKANPRFSAIKSVSMLHRLKTKDRELSQEYDRIAVKLNITNDGRHDSCVFQLHSFLVDSTNSQKKKIGSSSKQVSSPKRSIQSDTSSSEDEVDPLSDTSSTRRSERVTSSESNSKKKRLHMPAVTQLNHDDLVAYSLAKIRLGVQNIALSKALIQCIEAVHQYERDL